MKTVTVLGTGGWGTTLAVHLARLDKHVRLWGRDGALIDELRTARLNSVYLPGITLPQSVLPTADLERAVSGTDCVVAAVPSHGARDVLRCAARSMPARVTIVSAAKGLEVGSLLRMSQVIEQEVGSARPIVVLSGPTFASEVARGAPTAVLAAGTRADEVEAVQEEFRSKYFRLYGSDDVIGVEMGGAMKNVIAIAAGVVESLGLGHNALAALITRGLAEISRLACAVGGRRETLAGLSGLGDLVLTCTGELSRNRRVGIELGRGRSLADILGSMRMVAEGVRTTGAALALGHGHDVELPITSQMADVFGGRKEPRAAVEELMLRPQRLEPDRVGE